MPIGPGLLLSREAGPGLWAATTGFAVEVEGVRALLAPATAVLFTTTSPLPDSSSRCRVDTMGGLAVDRHFSPQTLIGRNLDHDYAPIVVPNAADLAPAMPGASGALSLGDAGSGLPKAVKIVVARGSGPTVLDGILTTHAAMTRNRAVTPSGGIVAVTYTSSFQVELTGAGTQFVADDAGAPVYAQSAAGTETLGVVLWPFETRRAMVTNIRTIFDVLPINSRLL